MWRKLRNHAYSRQLINNVEFYSSIGSSGRTRCSGWMRYPGEFTFAPWKNHEIPRPLIASFYLLDGALTSRQTGMRRIEFSNHPFGFCMKRGYAVAAEVLTYTETDEGTEEEGEEKRGLDKVKLLRYFFRDLKRESEMSKDKYLILRRRQIKMETEAWDQAAKEYRELLADMCEQKLVPNLPYMKSLLLGWFEPFRDAISEDQKSCLRKKNMVNTYRPFFNDLPADMMAVITMHKLMGLLMAEDGTGGVRVHQAASAVGEVIEHEARIFKLFEMAKKARKTPGEESPTFSHEKEKLRKKVSNFIKKRQIRQVKHTVNKQDDSKPWGLEIQMKVGSRLIQLLMETAYIQSPSGQLRDAPPDIRPAFVHSIKITKKEAWNMSRRHGVIECDPFIRKGMEKTARYMVIPYMPMLIPPLKWSRYNKGAHLFLPSYIMRTHGAITQREAIKKAPAPQLKPVFEALDTLGGTKWRVNKRVLSIVDRIWADDGCLAGLISRKDLPFPEKPDTEDESEITEWKWKVKDVKKENRERNSLRCDTELKLAVAQKMKDEDGFFYPHNLDFRGRAYPMHPHLNHLGSDLCRGILEFAQGRPLGKAGLKWLKIQLANLFAGGVDRLPISDRISFTENHMHDIFDSAERPLEGRRWWLNAEDPFQCLAACINIYEAMRSSSPETYISHMPVHQDGSCNGLQHYAALGRDKLGAAAVNLVSSEHPSDVYSGIAVRVLEIMKGDAKQDPDTCRDAFYAKLLVGQVDRKLVKQTVMTSVYGVTYVGAREQISKKLKERGVIPDGRELFAASHYATKATLMALGEMFEAARRIMSWLGDCAKIIAVNNQPVSWTTPIGLPVVQPYRKFASYAIKTSLQILTLHRETNKVMARRQKSAFPPNFVHSLDGAHMMMTALACRKEGLNFAGVHDSYWTHACDVEDMNRILREKFVELYEMPILENLLESFRKSFPKLEFPPLPERGDFDLREVLESPYFFN